MPAIHEEDIVARALAGTDVRREVTTGEHARVVAMSMPPGGEFGNEAHHVGQFPAFVAGRSWPVPSRTTPNRFVWPLALFCHRDLHMPARLMLGVWFSLQVAFGLSWMSGGAGMEGVAYLGHVAGYVAGFAFALLLWPGRHRNERR
jgi:membrane associated rhomboid family serine protease